MNVILLLFSWLLFALYLYKNHNHLNRWTIVFLISRSTSSLLFIWVYTTFYKGDLSQYITISQDWSNHPLSEIIFNSKHINSSILEEPRMFFFAKIFHLIYTISFSNLFLTSLLFTSIGSVFLIESYKIVKSNNAKITQSFLIALCIPSIVFWSSGICKESLSFPAFIYLTLIIWSYLEKQKKDWKLDYSSIFTFTLLVLSLIIISKLRYFYFPFILLLLGIYALVNLKKQKLFWILLPLPIVLYFFFQNYLIPQLQFENLLELTYSNYHKIVQLSGNKNYMLIPYKNPDLWSLSKAYISAFKGVFFTSFSNIFISIISIENLIILTLIAINFKKLNKKETLPLLITSIFFSAYFCLISPNYGSLSRYRIIYWFWWVWFCIEQTKSLLINQKASSINLK
jgi:uncharacterized membrane protein (UPF0136 family)